MPWCVGLRARVATSSGAFVYRVVARWAVVKVGSAAQGLVRRRGFGPAVLARCVAHWCLPVFRLISCCGSFCWHAHAHVVPGVARASAFVFQASLPLAGKQSVLDIWSQVVRSSCGCLVSWSSRRLQAETERERERETMDAHQFLRVAPLERLGAIWVSAIESTGASTC